MATISNTPAKSNNLAATDKIPVGVQGSDAALTVTGAQVKAFCNESEGTVTSSATNIQSIRIKTTDGKAVEISKAEAIKLFNFGANSMAELAKGVDGSISLVAVANGASVDMNTYTTSGKYTFNLTGSTKPTHYPVDETWDCLLEVFSINSAFITQRATFNRNEIYTRTYRGNVWSAWVRVDNFGYSTITELSHAVATTNGEGYVVIKSIAPNEYADIEEFNSYAVYGIREITSSGRCTIVALNREKDIEVVFDAKGDIGNLYTVTKDTNAGGSGHLRITNRANANRTFTVKRIF